MEICVGLALGLLTSRRAQFCRSSALPSSSAFLVLPLQQTDSRQAQGHPTSGLSDQKSTRARRTWFPTRRMCEEMQAVYRKHGASPCHVSADACPDAHSFALARVISVPSASPRYRDALGPITKASRRTSRTPRFSERRSLRTSELRRRRTVRSSLGCWSSS